MAPSNLGFHNPCLPVRVPITHLLLVCASSLLILFFFGLPNLQTTKASNQECTLRFYPHAENLRPIHGMHFVSLNN